MTSSRPRRLVGILGTHTGVGKTWTTIELLQRLQAKGVRVSVRKPVQSFDMGDPATDADLLAAASHESPHEVCKPHHWYTRPMAPPMAADVLQRARILIDKLATQLDWPARTDIGFIETVGGPRSPLAHDGDSVDLLYRCEVDELLLVADAGLGTINAVRLAASACGRLPLTVLLNRFDSVCDLHQRNGHWLSNTYGLKICTDLNELAATLGVPARDRDD